MNPKSMRKEIRLPALYLPEDWQEVTLLFEGSEISGGVLNASASGFGLVVSIPEERLIRGTRISLQSKGATFSLHGEIVFTRRLTASLSRLGISLLETRGYDEYRSMIATILTKHPELH